jgi:DNA-binding Lrp family transcriptional regulator
VDCALLNQVQKDFPLDSRPFATIGARLGMTERAVLDRLQCLEAEGAISRFGAVFKPNVVGCSTLAALAVPQARIDEVAATVNATPGVNHNYLREHEYNLWFVIVGRDRAELDQRLAAIAEETGCPLLDLPLEQAYHIDLGFTL